MQNCVVSKDFLANSVSQISSVGFSIILEMSRFLLLVVRLGAARPGGSAVGGEDLLPALDEACPGLAIGFRDEAGCVKQGVE